MSSTADSAPPARTRVRGRRRPGQRPAERLWSPLLYLLGLASSEAALQLGAASLGLVGYALMLGVGLHQAGRSGPADRGFHLALALLPLGRLIVAMAPLAAMPMLFWPAATAVPLGIAIWRAAQAAGLSLRDLGLTISWRIVGLSLLLAPTAVALGVVASSALAIEVLPASALAVLPQLPGGTPGARGTVDPSGPSAVALVSLLAIGISAAVVDEVVFRGFLQHAAKLRLGTVRGVAFSAALFAALAASMPDLPHLGAALGAGLAFSIAREASGSIVPGAVAHAAFIVGLIILGPPNA
jgi:membrane protease YdiL (CAAX protease family)